MLTSGEQLVADAAASREDPREAEGYVAPLQATAFLELGRDPADGAVPGADPATALERP